jgi:transcriptional regulator with XRE-family HTH domain
MTTSYGDRLRAARVARNLTLADVAQQVCCSAPYLSDLENGNRIPTTRTPVVVRLHATLGVDLDPTPVQKIGPFRCRIGRQWAGTWGTS